MAFVAQLWLPTLLSALFVFFASAISWMAMPHHRNEWKQSADALVYGCLMGGTFGWLWK